MNILFRVFKMHKYFFQIISRLPWGPARMSLLCLIQWGWIHTLSFLRRLLFNRRLLSSRLLPTLLCRLLSSRLLLSRLLSSRLLLSRRLLSRLVLSRLVFVVCFSVAGVPRQCDPPFASLRQSGSAAVRAREG